MGISTLFKRILDSKYRVLMDAGYITTEGKLTDAGRTQLDNIVFEANEDELARRAQSLLDAKDAKKES